ncbi:MAG: hypothetical protein Ct9H300mP20_05240 [Gammaproteobacteria bacterium]|nr:MAG: hypothetical protein Ct9H300mP20_05240 [Gammaproteobacteria bacterium]
MAYGYDLQKNSTLREYSTGKNNPRKGGDTLFASLSAAYSDLPEDLKGL